MPDKSLIYWLWIVMVMGIAHKSTPSIIMQFPDIYEMYQEMLNPECSFMKANQKKRANQIPLEKAEEVLHFCNQNQISIMPWNSVDYPKKLRHIYNPPALLFYQGNPEVLRHDRMMTAVGTRHPSEYSQLIAKKLYPELVSAGYTLVSGCAVGLDTAAHHAAIDHHQPTIAVLGCGLDRDYPKGSRELKQKIIENGLLLTEFFPGTPPYSSNFPVRNRIMIGISNALFVLEAGISSGCLNTAGLACDQGKPVFCIPPADIYDPRYAGQIRLLRDGAVPVYGMAELTQEIPASLQKKSDASKKMTSPKSHPKKQKTPEIPVQPSPLDQNPDFQALSPEERTIVKSLSESQKNPNMLCCMTGMDFVTISIHLLELEMLGWIVHDDKDFYTLSDNYKGKFTS